MGTLVNVTKNNVFLPLHSGDGIINGNPGYDVRRLVEAGENWKDYLCTFSLIGQVMKFPQNGRTITFG